MNPFSANYTPNQAHGEYQARTTLLNAQRQADKAAGLTASDDQLATYTLAERLPDWGRLLDIEKPQVWSTASLLTACDVLRNPALVGSSVAIARQLESFTAELATRA